MTENIAYLSLGSNIGDRESNLREAMDRLGRIGNVEAVSSLYETEPVDVLDQPWFLNCAIKMRTTRSPQELLSDVLAIEREMGRERVRPKGPRNIDIDILLYNAEIIDIPGLTIPHPRMADRLFVLEPLAEIAPNLIHPKLEQPVITLKNRLSGSFPVVRKSKK